MNEREDKNLSNSETNNLNKIISFPQQDYESSTKQNQNYNAPLSSSSKNISPLINLQQKFFGKGKEVSPTILDKKIKDKSSNEIPKIIPGENKLKNINKNDFLKVRKIKKISENDFLTLKNEIIGMENLDLLYEDIINCNYLPLNEIDFSANVGCILPFSSLVESLFNSNIITIEEMNYRYELFKKYIFNYRPIKGDGNCFYRAIIFRYFEIVILNKKIELLKNIISEMYESFNSNEIRSRLRVKYNFIINTRLVLHIMIIILNLLEEGRISDAHYFYVKTIVIEDSFDYGLIIYFRYIFYLYIKQNENKIYLEDFAIKIGNLLPSNYETNEGMFLFNKFYYLYLLSMFTDAEKIIIHLTPFVLGINLDVIIFNDNEDKTIKNMIFSGKCEYNFNEEKLFVLNINGHYELLYSEDDNIKNKDIFKEYINDYYYDMSKEQVPKNYKNNGNQDVKNVKEKDNCENNTMIESSSQSQKKNLIFNNDIENNQINEERELKNKNETVEINNKYKVQIKIINKSAQKPQKPFLFEEEKKEEDNIISEKIKYSEQKDTNYQNLIKNRNNDENNNSNKKDNNESNIIDNNQENKQININRVNLIEKMDKEVDNDENIINEQKKANKNELANDNLNSQTKKNIKEYSKSREEKCESCLKNYIKKNNNIIFNNICENCLKKNIINEIYPKFLEYMKDAISKKIFDFSFKIIFNDFVDKKIEIFNNNITIRNALEKLNNNYKSKFEMHPIFGDIKKKFCIFCLCDLNKTKTKYEIPCKCNFCSIDHIKRYFHMINNFKNKSNYICICSHEYSNIDIYNIGIFFYLNKLYSLKEDTIDFLNQNYLDKQCCFCSISIGNNNRKRIKIKDFEDEIILGDTNKLKHYICDNCFYQYGDNVETFSCFICNKNHIVINKN